MNPIEILLVEDNPGDVRLTQEALKESKLNNNLHVASDGIEGLEMLKGDEMPRPDIILLDLNLPRMNGLELLQHIKDDAALRTIPVVVLTTSDDEEDIWRSYNLHVNCYITKPVDIDQFVTIVRTIEDFWFTIVRLPKTR